MPTVIDSLLHSRKFWLALFGVVQTVIFNFVPNFPRDIWIAIDLLVGVVIAGVTVEDAAAKSAGNTPSRAGVVVPKDAQ